MASVNRSHPSNVEGPWFVDLRCIGCGAARHWAPGLISADSEGKSVVTRQPTNADEEGALWRAAVACPTKSVGNRESHGPLTDPFPFELTPGVFALGHNSPRSFGAHSYLVARDHGNLMIDTPRFNRALASSIEARGGVADILLTHRDHVGDADRWAERFGARVWIHQADADSAPNSTDILTADEWISQGVHALYTPGHTKGHVVFHVEDKWLFTGDTLFWNPVLRILDVAAAATWYSWEIQSDSLDRLAQLHVDWIFAGHGKWHHIHADDFAAQMSQLGPAMRNIGREAWRSDRQR